ncbi:acyl-ACP desaturase [Maribacter litopenaei]|uniref:Acyl-ACP desaturase n=1 Tax=Maribacter litopenaei TaxID=2976127 RepID=A0ABY5Y985_9FLAO|nr:acyl-ACP desaturase [Maribacter litopenaei]UWX54809.1 acyl-ACP desaturase [Maribacter litopenaei]
MAEKNIRLEVMQALEPKVAGFMESFLVPIEKIWQPSDFLRIRRKMDFWRR